MSEFRHGLRRWRWAAAGFAAVAAFAVLAGRFWHPYYGFTKFVQLDESDARNGIHEIRENPVFVYEGFNGYDGAAYAQIAFDPLLDSPELQPALGNVPYRARRILGSALAWLLAAGEPSRIANVYAALNLGVWLALAMLLWRILPVVDARSWLAWAGVLFSAGALHSVRLALTDLLAATLVVAAIRFDERGRMTGALGTLAAAGLARETALAAVVGLWRGPWKTPRAWSANLFRTVIVALPLLAWIIYVRWKAGPAAQGFGNFTWPIVGWIEKWLTTLADFTRQPNFRWLNTTTLLATIALTAQAVYILRRRGSNGSRGVLTATPEQGATNVSGLPERSTRDGQWWRVGLSGVAMMALLGTSVWEGHPGAATRILFPMSIAFAVVAVRERAGVGWIIAGSLTVFSGILALWHVPYDSREIAAGRFDRGAYVARLESGWYGTERNGRAVWAWSAGGGTLAIETSPHVAGSVRVALKLRAIQPRKTEIRAGESVAWQGEVGERVQRIEFSAPMDAHGRLQLNLQSAAPPVPENNHADARALGFAVYGVSIE